MYKHSELRKKARLGELDRNHIEFINKRIASIKQSADEYSQMLEIDNKRKEKRAKADIKEFASIFT